jgi:hypothetical protein
VAMYDVSLRQRARQCPGLNLSKPLMRILILALLAGMMSAPAMAQLMLPANAACISSAYGPRVIPNLPAAGTYHNGVDLPVTLGTPVYAISAGHLLRVQNRGPGGLEILIQHGGFIGVYSHLGSTTLTGSEVIAGQQIGVVGATGVSLGPHLFFGMLLDNHLSVDPKPFLDLPLCSAVKPAVVAAHAPPHVSEIWAVGHNLASSKRYLVRDLDRPADVAVFKRFPAALTGAASRRITPTAVGD